MICISIAQESRRLALVDMLNAANQCDLLEVRLDRFGRAPDIKELLDHKPRPIIFSCRRHQDGGSWEGSESDRLALLRQCIISKADYVEIELDVADQIRKFPPTKRIITYTNMLETPPDIAEIYDQAAKKNPDIIKLTTLARAPEEAWPLLYVLANATVPTVVVGLGKPGIMLSVLGKKIGAPWTYAALEKGMEAYPGQPTVRELNEVYDYRGIHKETRFFGVTGFGEREKATVAVVNTLLSRLEIPHRCLPLGLGSISLFQRIGEAVHLKGLLVDMDHHGAIMQIAASSNTAAEQAHGADLLLRNNKVWRAYNMLGQAGLTALEDVLRAKGHTDAPLRGRAIMIVGVNPAARAIAFAAKEREALVIIASHDRTAAQQLAQALECRYVAFEALYTTMHDVLVVCDPEKEASKGKSRPTEAGIHTGYLRAGMTVMDLTTSTDKSTLLREAAMRGCGVVWPRKVLREQIALQMRKITGRDIPLDVLDTKLNAALPEED